jgi:hypothetical protein
MAAKTVRNRQQVGYGMSGLCLFAGITGFIYQFMPDGILLTFMVCVVAVLGLVNQSKSFDERENQLLLQSYGTTFIYLFFAILFVYMFEIIFGKLSFIAPIIATLNAHWVGIMMSVISILIGIAGIRNFREIK